MKISATVHAPWQTVHERLVRKLRDKGFEARRTFDLQLARRLLKSSEEEPCPHHGTAPCNCQYLAMQIIGHDRSPSAVIIHGHDQTTTISFLTGAGEELRQDTAAAVYEALSGRPGSQRRQAASFCRVAREWKKKGRSAGGGTTRWTMTVTCSPRAGLPPGGADS